MNFILGEFNQDLVPQSVFQNAIKPSVGLYMLITSYLRTVPYRMFEAICL